MATILATLGGIGMHMLMSLMTETFLKKALIIGLEKLAAKTATDSDDKLVAAAKDAWK